MYNFHLLFTISSLRGPLEKWSAKIFSRVHYILRMEEDSKKYLKFIKLAHAYCLGLDLVVQVAEDINRVVHFGVTEVVLVVDITMVVIEATFLLID